MQTQESTSTTGSLTLEMQKIIIHESIFGAVSTADSCREYISRPPMRLLHTLEHAEEFRVDGPYNYPW
jgi:hypothetical protein